jgi:hypothetical protein
MYDLRRPPTTDASASAAALSCGLNAKRVLSVEQVRGSSRSCPTYSAMKIIDQVLLHFFSFLPLFFSLCSIFFCDKVVQDVLHKLSGSF